MSTVDIKICFGNHKDTPRMYNSLRTFFFKQMFVIEEQGLRLFLNKKENNHVLITYHFIYVYILLQLLIS